MNPATPRRGVDRSRARCLLGGTRAADSQEAACASPVVEAAHRCGGCGPTHRLYRHDPRRSQRQVGGADDRSRCLRLGARQNGGHRQRAHGWSSRRPEFSSDHSLKGRGAESVGHAASGNIERCGRATAVRRRDERRAMEMGAAQGSWPSTRWDSGLQAEAWRATWCALQRASRQGAVGIRCTQLTIDAREDVAAATAGTSHCSGARRWPRRMTSRAIARRGKVATARGALLARRCHLAFAVSRSEESCRNADPSS